MSLLFWHSCWVELSVVVTLVEPASTRARQQAHVPSTAQLDAQHGTNAGEGARNVVPRMPARRRLRLTVPRVMAVAITCVCVGRAACMSWAAYPRRAVSSDPCVGPRVEEVLPSLPRGTRTHVNLQISTRILVCAPPIGSPWEGARGRVEQSWLRGHSPAAVRCHRPGK